MPTTCAIVGHYMHAVVRALCRNFVLVALRRLDPIDIVKFKESVGGVLCALCGAVQCRSTFETINQAYGTPSK